MKTPEQRLAEAYKQMGRTNLVKVAHLQMSRYLKACHFLACGL